ncbi:hypothetical protein A4X13_0g2096 [Tilletia indica]|uniref:Uncharacterized protein n=1 Tax=Tilletia indica TaxID=43049 RepID=A0A177TX80_9BASI|nr:hypothetical protein A4X13_0g2096 [Tilletia indica]
MISLSPSPPPSSQAEESNTPDLSQTSTLTSISDAESLASHGSAVPNEENEDVEAEVPPSPGMQEFINDTDDLGHVSGSEESDGSTHFSQRSQPVAALHPVGPSVSAQDAEPSASNQSLDIAACSSANEQDASTSLGSTDIATSSGTSVHASATSTLGIESPASSSSPVQDTGIPGPSAEPDLSASTNVHRNESSSQGTLPRRSSRPRASRRNVFILSDSEEDSEDSDYEEDDEGDGHPQMDGMQNDDEEQLPEAELHPPESDPSDGEGDGDDQVAGPDFFVDDMDEDIELEGADEPLEGEDEDVGPDGNNSEDDDEDEDLGHDGDNSADEDVVEWLDESENLRMRQLGNGEQYFFHPLSQTWVHTSRLIVGNRYNPVNIDD